MGRSLERHHRTERAAYSTIRTGALLKTGDVKEPRKRSAETPTWLFAVRAAESKKATDIKVLDLTGITSFADFFVICSGSNSRQIQAIADDVQLRLKKLGERANSIEGYENAEWVLMDYGDYLIHIFSEKARTYYDLERLWRDGKPVELV